jgi:hypothetical protein
MSELDHIVDVHHRESALYGFVLDVAAAVFTLVFLWWLYS